MRIGDAVVPRGLAAFTAADWAAIPAGPIDLVLAPADVFGLTLAAGPARRAVAAALAGRSPLAPGRACWAHVGSGDGHVRVAMAHRATVRAAVRLVRAQGRVVATVTGDGVLLWRRAEVAVSPWWLLAAIPAVTGIGAWGLTVAGTAELARVRPAALARARTAATQDAVAAVFARTTVSGLLARIEAVLPAGATLHALAGTPDGAIELTIDASDPGPVRTALGRDPLLAGLRTVGQAAVADRGIRMRLRGRAS